MLKPINVLVADDHRLFRQGLISLMNTRPDLVRVVGEAESGRQAVAMALSLQPDVILMDIYMPNGNGLEAAKTILNRLPDVAVVMLTSSELDEHLYESVRLGVAGYLLKNLDADDLFELIEGVTRGEAALTRPMATRLLKRMANQAIDEKDRGNGLTGRENEVLQLIAQGASNPEIAAKLHITINTVKTHISHILAKLQVENRTQAAALAVQRGLLPKKSPL